MDSNQRRLSIRPHDFDEECLSAERVSVDKEIRFLAIEGIRGVVRDLDFVN